MPRERRLAGAGRPPEDERLQQVALDRLAQRRARARAGPPGRRTRRACAGASARRAARRRGGRGGLVVEESVHASISDRSSLSVARLRRGRRAAYPPAGGRVSFVRCRRASYTTAPPATATFSDSTGGHRDRQARVGRVDECGAQAALGADSTAAGPVRARRIERRRRAAPSRRCGSRSPARSATASSASGTATTGSRRRCPSTRAAPSIRTGRQTRPPRRHRWRPPLRRRARWRRRCPGPARRTRNDDEWRGRRQRSPRCARARAPARRRRTACARGSSRPGPAATTATRLRGAVRLEQATSACRASPVERRRLDGAAARDRRSQQRAPSTMQVRAVEQQRGRGTRHQRAAARGRSRWGGVRDPAASASR